MRSLASEYAGQVELTRIHGHLILSKEGVLTFPRKPDSFELEVGRFHGLP
jgi:hypothetical protein